MKTDTTKTAPHTIPDQQTMLGAVAKCALEQLKPRAAPGDAIAFAETLPCFSLANLPFTFLLFRTLREVSDEAVSACEGSIVF